MAEDLKRNEYAALAPSYGLTGQLAAIVEAAEGDPDPVAMLTLGEDASHCEAAIVVLKGQDTVTLFRQWATRNRILGSAASGMLAAIGGNDHLGDTEGRDG